MSFVEGLKYRLFFKFARKLSENNGFGAWLEYLILMTKYFGARHTEKKMARPVQKISELKGKLIGLFFIDHGFCINRK